MYVDEIVTYNACNNEYDTVYAIENDIETMEMDDQSMVVDIALMVIAVDQMTIGLLEMVQANALTQTKL